MAIIIPDGIKFKYVKIVNGVTSIDSVMTDEKFYASKPNGYYKCFIFPKADFAGNEYWDLVNLVSIEEANMWDKTNRDTFFGYNEESRTFICNITAYMGLKDSDLKTDGQISHSGQVGWYEMSFTTTASSGIIKLKQTDGTDIYLKIKDHVYKKRVENPSEAPFSPDAYLSSSGNVCVQNKKKSVAGSAVFIKNDALWCKSSEDGSALMVRNNITKNNYTYRNDRQSITYENSKRIEKRQQGSLYYYYQSILYGKPIVYFLDTSRFKCINNEKVNASNRISSRNQNSLNYKEYTETNNISDIVKPNQSVMFNWYPHQEYSCLSGDATGAFKYRGFGYQYLEGLVAEYGINLTNTKLDCYLKACDINNKAFVFYPKIGDLRYVKSANKIKMEIDLTKFKESLPDGFIALFFSISLSEKYRLKKGEKIKKRQAHGYFTTISGTSNYPSSFFSMKISSESEVNNLTAETISKNDLIAGTGFVDITTDEYKTNILFNEILIVNTNDS